MSDHNIKIVEPIDSVRGQITLPGDKSMSHRALMFAAIAKGVSKIKHLNIGADALSTIACLQKLGVNFQLGKFTVDVDSPGINGWKQPQDGILNCGNSGTTVRLMSGLLAGRENLNVMMIGGDSLSTRPMKRVIEPLKKMGADIYKPIQLHNFSMYLDGKWFSMTAREMTYNDDDPIGVLDVTILSKLVLENILGIKDLRTDKRVDFVGGIRGLGELKRRVDNGEMKVAFALYHVSMKQLIDIADTGNIMPPKTTWFEPKLRSGLVVHSLD